MNKKTWFQRFLDANFLREHFSITFRRLYRKHFVQNCIIYFLSYYTKSGLNVRRHLVYIFTPIIRNVPDKVSSRYMKNKPKKGHNTFFSHVTFRISIFEILVIESPKWKNSIDIKFISNSTINNPSLYSCLRKLICERYSSI